ncbi:MAG: MFS transporter [Acholeplasmataceae bacterium]|nr:MFS transporter [Acholeplasmataceae bacterium]
MKTTSKNNVFRNKNFTLLFFGVLVSNIAHVLFNFAISLYVLRVANQAYGAKQAAITQAVYLAIAGIVLLIFMPLGGVLADKLNKVRIMYMTDFIRGFTIAATALVIFFVDHTLTILIVLFLMNIILSINSAIFNPASSSLLRFIVDDESLQQASAYLQGSSNLQNIIGLILGGIIYATLGIQWIFLINAFGYLFSAISEMFIRYDYLEHTEADVEISFKVMTADFKSGLSYLFSQKALFATVMMALFLNFFFSPLFSNGLPYFIEFGLANESRYLFDHFLTPETWYAVISVSISISSILMALILSRQKTKTKYHKQLKLAIVLSIACTTMTSVFMVLYYLQKITIDVTLIGLVISLFFTGFTLMSFNVPITLIFQRNVEPKQLGKVSSVMSVLTQALVPLGSLVAGVIIAQLGPMYLFIFSVVGALIVGIHYVTNKKVNEL